MVIEVSLYTLTLSVERMVVTAWLVAVRDDDMDKTVGTDVRGTL